VDIGLDPKATYLHVASADSALDSPAIDLAALGLVPGDMVRLERLGLFDNGPQGETFGSLLGVFSSTNVLLPPANFHRVPGAIEAGVDFNSACTFFGCEPTNIPEDFAIGAPDASFTGICMVIPPGAAYLFVGPHDSLSRTTASQRRLRAAHRASGVHRRRCAGRVARWRGQCG
jgi:hypothetical protein